MFGSVLPLFQSNHINTDGDFDEKRKIIYFSIFLSEFLATTFLILIGCLGCATELYDVSIPPHFSALIFGLAITTSVQIFGRISGAHMNPQVTLAALILGKITVGKIPVYITGQFMGAITGYGLLWAFLPETYREGVCVNNFNEKFNIFQVLGLEAILTAVVVFSIAAMWDVNNFENNDSFPLRLGLIVSCVAMVANPITSLGINSARSFAPALINWSWKNHWVYWVGPTSGAILAALLYRFIFEKFESLSDKETLEISK